MKNRTVINIVLTVAAPFLALLLLVLTNIDNSIDKNSEGILNALFPAEPDTSIVLIEINETDIKQLEWPLRRNYYALLVRALTELEAKKVAIEVFLASGYSSQQLYNDLLLDEIKKSDRVVLSAITSELKENFSSDTLELPEPALMDNTLPIGHINYLEVPRYTVPLKVSVNGRVINSLAAELAGKSTESESQVITVNFRSESEKFKRISLLDFFERYEQEPEALSFIKGKTVVIGVTDPGLSKLITTPTKETLAGVFLHLYTLDTILKNQSISTSFEIPIALVLSLFFLSIGFIAPKQKLYIALGVGAITVIAFPSLYLFFAITVPMSFVILPLLFMAIDAGLQKYTETKTELDLSLEESALLKNLLGTKEKEQLLIEQSLGRMHGEEKNNYELMLLKLKEEIEQLRAQQNDLKPYVPDEKSRRPKMFHGILYYSPIMEQQITMIQKTAPQDVTILIMGDSGTGKELIAKAIHELSPRNKQRFVAVNCAALSSSLLESELFGHKKGSFTGAVSDKQGKFEYADGGTIFLDEIGETNDAFQAKLLRVLQSGEISKVGAEQTQKVNVRVVAATNKQLPQLVKEKKFREDLFYRLNVIQIQLPSLAERREDIPYLTDYFVHKESPEMEISSAAVEQLAKAEWKGNIRELESIVKRAVILAKAEGRTSVQLQDLPDTLVVLERDQIGEVILSTLRAKQFSHNSISETAKELGNIHRGLVTEHLRGLFFKEYVLQGFDFEKAVEVLAGTSEKQVIEKLTSKVEKYLTNVQEDVRDAKGKGFEETKLTMTAKYKNLPRQYHNHLDAVLREMISRG